MFDSARKHKLGEGKVKHKGTKPVQEDTLIPVQNLRETYVADPGSEDQNLSAMKLFLKTGAFKALVTH